ncbi:TIGR04283 family arsenosugar biosynthesis glycosyltransferase [Muriicola sp. Z0-33]|uniref:TIGR04283 family arsenosugar biosynthesis glycosyltransferase n=1 Tax=Muriicola sp. Z0-33 TaxID=2816957 RepID=UPI0022381C92|nr:TIGR04283 family arsenosugar biosynthesis glycosyltransferase [Muriicola sp. Z0-33]MCW5515116.1 TIGR04283 family arsenosugar biosynthesis glycosyltransferase [Muriicola sp. Z0-33]
MSNPRISIIIPVLNEEDAILKVLRYLKHNSSEELIQEILVVDGGSKDNTVQIAKDFGVDVIISSRGRAKQMNLGAMNARGDIFYFLHVDTLPPRNFDQSIINAVHERHEVGCFQLQFDSNSRFLKFFAWFSRVNHTICRGGDQSLFITRKLFFKAKGFNEDYIVYEDNEFIRRLYKKTYFKILPQRVQTSARRYEERGIVQLQYHFGMIHLNYYLGAGPEKLYKYYRRNIII